MPKLAITWYKTFLSCFIRGLLNVYLIMWNKIDLESVCISPFCMGQGRYATQVNPPLCSIPPFCVLSFLQVTFRGNIRGTSDDLSETVHGKLRIYLHYHLCTVGGLTFNLHTLIYTLITTQSIERFGITFMANSIQVNNF